MYLLNVYVYTFLFNWWIHTSNKQKEIPHRAGSKWTLTERDWTGPLREDIVEWIAARDGALAWLDWTRLGWIKLNCTGLASTRVDCAELFCTSYSVDWTCLGLNCYGSPGLDWRSEDSFVKGYCIGLDLIQMDSKVTNRRTLNSFEFITLDWWTSPHRTGVNRTGPHQIRWYIFLLDQTVELFLDRVAL